MTLAGPHSGAELSTGDRLHGIAAGYQRSVVPLLLLMIGSYVLLKPYYLFPSGLPQIGDMVIAMALPFALLLPQLRQGEDARGLQFHMVLFCSYAALVNLGWTFALMDPRVALYATYYAFNLCLMVVCLRVGMLYPRETLLTIAYAVSISAIIQAATVALGYDLSRARQIASFNNPNQLGYWSVLSLCMFWSIAGKAKIKWYIQAPTVVCLFYTAAASLSKSAIISTALLCALHFVKRPKLLFIGLLALAPAYLVVENSMLVERVSGRLQNIGQQEDDQIHSRGYVRILYYPEYVVVGAGEGALYRFPEGVGEDMAKSTEIHSTFGTILFSYGLIGLVAFGAAIWRLYRISSAGRFLYLLPPFFYGLTHQGLRFSFLWLLFAIIAILGSTTLQEISEGRQGEHDRRKPVKSTITSGKPEAGYP
jgi:O-Antigen ligase